MHSQYCPILWGDFQSLFAWMFIRIVRSFLNTPCNCNFLFCFTTLDCCRKNSITELGLTQRSEYLFQGSISSMCLELVMCAVFELASAICKLVFCSDLCSVGSSLLCCWVHDRNCCNTSCIGWLLIPHGTLLGVCQMKTLSNYAFL